MALALDEGSGQIADRAVQLANDHDAQLIGVHVLENMELDQTGLPSPLDPDTLAALMSSERSERLEDLFEAANRPAMTKVDAGKSHAVIEAWAASHGADLIVIGPGVPRNLREKVWGSTADRVVRSALCPVLVVRNPGTTPYRHIAVGIDFSEHANAAARFITLLAPSALNEFIHAIQIPPAFEQAMLKAGTSQQEIGRYRSAKATEARQQLLERLAKDDRPPKSRRMKIVHGDAATALLNASRRGRSDLVALGTQGTHPLAQQLLGSVAQKVLAGSKSDVLVVPSSAV